MRKFFKYILLVGIISVSSCISAPGNVEIDFFLDKKFFVGATSNGTSYYVRSNVQQEGDNVFLGLVVHAGSVLETDEQLGLAHFVEHMAFNGTEKFPGNTIIEKLQKEGVRFGADLNAYTDFNETVFYISIPNKPELLDLGLDVLLEWSRNLSYEEEAIEKEKPVVLEELRAYDSDARKFERDSFLFMFGDSKYAQRDPGGRMEVVQDSPRSVIKKFYDDWYKPNLMAVTVIGDVDTKAVAKKIEERFSYADTQATLPEIPVSIGKPGDIIIKRGVYDNLRDTVSLYFTHPKVRPDSLEHIYDSISASIIYNVMRKQISKFEESGGILGGYASSVNLMEDYTITSIEIGVLNNNYEEAIRSIFNYIQSIQEYGITQEQIDDVLEGYFSNFDEKRKYFENGYFFSHARSAFIDQYPLIDQQKLYAYLNKYRKEIFTPERINRVLKPLFTTSGTRIVIAGDEESSTPQEAEMREIVTSVLASDTQPVEIIEPLDVLISDEEVKSLKKAGNIVKQSKHPQYKNGTRFILGNGMQVDFFRSKEEFNSNAIIIHAMALGGMQQLIRDKSEQEIITAKYISRFGKYMHLDGHSYRQIQYSLSSRWRIYYYPGVLENARTFNVASRSGHREVLEKAFQIMHMYFSDKKTAAPNIENLLRASVRQDIEQIYDNPESLASARFTALTEKHNVFSRVSERGEENKIDIQRGIEMYKSLTQDPQSYTVTIIADFPVSKVKALVKTYLASIPRGKDREVYVSTDRGLAEAGQQEEGTYPDTKQSIAVFGWRAVLDTQELTLRDAILSNYIESLLGVILTEEIREKEGGVYNINPLLSITPTIPESSYPNNKSEYQVGIFFGSEPSRARELREKTLSIIHGLKESSPSKEILERARAGVERGIDDKQYWFLTSQYWIEYGVRNLFHRDARDELRAILSDIDYQDVQEFLRKYLREDRFFSYLLEPESGSDTDPDTKTEGSIEGANS